MCDAICGPTVTSISISTRARTVRFTRRSYANFFWRKARSSIAARNCFSRLSNHHASERNSEKSGRARPKLARHGGGAPNDRSENDYGLGELTDAGMVTGAAASILLALIK